MIRICRIRVRDPEQAELFRAQRVVIENGQRVWAWFQNIGDNVYVRLTY